MRAAALVLLLTTALSVAGASRDFDVSHYQPLLTISVSSYGESASALVELIEPFFIKNRILPERPHYFSGDGTLIATYTHEGTGDIVLEKAQFNCMSITYYTWLLRFIPPTVDPKASVHAAELRAEVVNFLRKLPSPRTKIEDIEPGKTSSCVRAF